MGASQKSRAYLLIASLQTVMALFAVILFGSGTPVSAAVGINSQLSFEGKIVKADGTNIPNGTYNMQFNIYQDGDNQGTGSTLKWTENWLVGGNGGVTLTDGTFQVNLGAHNPFASQVDWNQDTLWLSMQIGNSSACTISTNFQTDCSGDGEMKPYIRLTAVPQALNSNMLGGLTAGNFVQLAQGLQTDVSTTNASIAINKTGGTANILQLQKSGTNVLLVDNTGAFTVSPTGDNVGSVFKQTSGVATSGSVFDIQTADGTGHFIQVTNTAANEGAVNISSIGASNNITLTPGSGTVNINGSILSGSTGLTVSGGASGSLSLNSASGDISISTSTHSITFAASGNSTATVRKNMTVSGLVNANDVVIVDGSNPGQVKQSTAARTGIVFGVATVSSTPAGPQDIVTYGVYQVNVATSSGAISVGDSLDLSNTPGQVTSGGCSDDVRYSVGHALSSVAAGAGGTVWAMINPGAGRGQGSGGCAAAVSTKTLQQTYTDSSNTGGTTTPEIKVTSTGGGLDIQDANVSIGGSLFTVRTSNSSALGTSILDVQSSGLVQVGSLGTSAGQLYVSGQIPSTYVSSIASAGGPSGITANGRYVYVINGTGSTFKVFDYSVSSSPAAVSSTNLGYTPASIVSAGSYVYISSTSSHLVDIYSLANPTTPTWVGRLNMTSLTPNKIAVSGSYLYFLDQSKSSLVAVDISNPAAPKIVGSIATDATPLSIDTSGSFVYVVSSAANTIKVYNVSQPSKMALLGTAAITSPTKIKVAGRYAYILGNSFNVYVYDLKDPANPVSAGSVGLSDFVDDLSISGRFLYLASNTKMFVLDISNPASPSSLGSLSVGTSPQYIAASGRYAYIASGGNNTIYAYDLGGAYIQQVEAGTIDSTSISITNDISIGRDAFVQGSLVTGYSLQSNGSLAVAGGTNLQGSTMISGGINQISAPTISSVTFTGATGGTAVTWTYVVTAINSKGGETIASGASSITAPASSNSTLSASNYNVITWGAVAGAAGYKVYRTTATGGTPSSTGLIGTTTGTNFNDTGLVGAANSAPTINTTGQLTVIGSALFKNSSNSVAAFEIQDSSGTSVMKADTTTNTITVSNLNVTGTCTGCGGSASTFATTYDGTTAANNLITINTTGGPVKIQDAATPTGGDLFTIQKNGGAVKYLGVTATGLNVQSNATGSAVNALALDTSTTVPHLKIYGANGTDYADIYYDSSTSTAYYGASTGTAVLGSGTGPVNVTAGTGTSFSITGNAASTIQTTAGNLNLQAGTGIVTVGTSSVAGVLSLFNGTNMVSIQGASSTAAYSIVLPASSGAANQCLMNSGTPGTLAWGACGGGVSSMTATLVPEYLGATMTGDGTNNIGTMTSDFCSGSGRLSINTAVCTVAADEHNYYSWTANATNDYDIWTRWQAPSDISTAVKPTVDFYNWGSSASDNVTLKIYNAGTACGTYSAVNGTGAWVNTTGLTTTSCTISGGNVVLLDIHLSVGVNGEFARAGEITIHYTRQ